MPNIFNLPAHLLTLLLSSDIDLLSMYQLLFQGFLNVGLSKKIIVQFEMREELCK